MRKRAAAGLRTRMQKVLRRRLESMKNLNSSTVDEIIQQLVSNYPEYKRHNRRSFIGMVEDSLYQLKSRQTQSPLEENNSSSDDDDNGAVSEPGEKGEPEPQFDLTKSMLHASYAGSNIKKKKRKEVEKNLELELDVSILKFGEEEGGARFKDLGGMKDLLEQLEMEVLVLLYHPQLPGHLGVDPVSGLLLHGPPGCGKTKLAHAIANETGVPFYKISATELVSGVSGESEENIRELFQNAYKTAPSIIFIDEIDAIASKRDTLQREMERRIVTQLMACMDANSYSFTSSNDDRRGYVLVIGATNRPNVLDPAIRRSGRLDYEIELSVPDENTRLQILSVLAKNKRLKGFVDLPKIARSTPGFVGADLKALVNKAGYLASTRIFNERKSKLSRDSVEEEQSKEWLKGSLTPEEMEKISITMADLKEAITKVQPSSRREGFSAIPDVKWEDVGGLDLLRKELDQHIVSRIKYPEKCERFGLNLEVGVLLYGPPGCGKTLIAKAVANEAGANFIYVKGPELLNKYVGESELAVRTLFSRARTCSPCIVFFDEVDALTTNRGKEEGSVIDRLVNQLLLELNGEDKRRGVFVIGATNRPEVMDKAILRPGRFGKLLYVPLPVARERCLILKALTRNRPLDASVDLDAIGRMEACNNFSGADLAALVDQAAQIALQDDLSESETIKTAHFEQAVINISPSVGPKQRQHYQILSETLKATT
ncbi:Spastin [Parasponia andersonii]|uniref:Spastin n=1 Tax=Parasponia andersonii TaxID=3476 RepID=A0A2P5DXZ6_PARAD|nr:Spastin [Parasponia andersonii]